MTHSNHTLQFTQHLELKQWVMNSVIYQKCKFFYNSQNLSKY